MLNIEMATKKRCDLIPHRPRGAPTRKITFPQTQFEKDAKRRSLLKIILSYLKLNEILPLRAVSKHWNEIICGEQGSYSSLLWIKGQIRVYEESGRNLNICVSELSNSNLVRFHKCSAYHFDRIDLRSESMCFFLYEFGKNIRSLKLNNCIVSFVTFKKLLLTSPLIENLVIIGIFNPLVPTPPKEPLFGNCETLDLGLKKLKCLHLESASEKITEIDKVVLDEIFKILNIPHLFSLSLSKFGQQTFHLVLDNISKRGKLELHALEFEKIGISNGVDLKEIATSLKILSKTCQLRKFVLTGLKTEGKLDDSLTQFIFNQPLLQEIDLSESGVQIGENIRLRKLKRVRGIFEDVELCDQDDACEKREKRQNFYNMGQESKELKNWQVVDSQSDYFKSINNDDQSNADEKLTTDLAQNQIIENENGKICSGGEDDSELLKYLRQVFSQNESLDQDKIIHETESNVNSLDDYLDQESNEIKDLLIFDKYFLQNEMRENGDEKVKIEGEEVKNGFETLSWFDNFCLQAVASFIISLLAHQMVSFGTRYGFGDKFEFYYVGVISLLFALMAWNFRAKQS